MVFFASMLFCGTAVAQNNMKDVVYLKNGGVVKGLIVEQVPNQSIKIQTADGSIFVYEMKDIEKMTKEMATNQYNGNGTQIKSPGAAWALSFFICGAGQMYNGQWGKGVAMLLSGPVLISLGSALSYNTEGWSMLVGSAAALGVWIWSQADAYSTAKRINAQGFAFNFEGGQQLAIRPDVSIVDVPLASTGKVITPGMNISFSF